MRIFRPMSLLVTVARLLFACRAGPNVPPTRTPEAPEPPALTLSIACEDVISKEASAHSLQPPFRLEITNTGAREARIVEVQGFNLDVPGRVEQSSSANASLRVIRLGEPKGPQTYSCAESTPREREERVLRAGETYRHGIDFFLGGIAPGEYELVVEFPPLGLSSPPRRVTIVP